MEVVLGITVLDKLKSDFCVLFKTSALSLAECTRYPWAREQPTYFLWILCCARVSFLFSHYFPIVECVAKEGVLKQVAPLFPQSDLL